MAVLWVELTVALSVASMAAQSAGSTVVGSAVQWEPSWVGDWALAKVVPMDEKKDVMLVVEKVAVKVVQWAA